MLDVQFSDISAHYLTDLYSCRVPDVLVVPFEYPDDSIDDLEIVVNGYLPKQTAYNFIFLSLTTGDNLELILMEEFDFHPTADQSIYIGACLFLAQQIQSELQYLGLMNKGVCVYDFYTRTPDSFVLLKKDLYVKDLYPNLF